MAQSPMLRLCQVRIQTLSASEITSLAWILVGGEDITECGTALGHSLAPADQVSSSHLTSDRDQVMTVNCDTHLTL